MMLPQRLSKLFENWPAKLISLVAAILIYVFYQLSILETKNIAVPISVYENGNVRVMSMQDKTAHVTVKGLRENIVSLESVDFKTYIDINSLTEEGEYEVPLKMQLSDNATVLENLEVKVTPAVIKVSVAEYASAYVPVSASVSGSPAHGYELGDVLIEPPSVKIYGPKDIVSSVDHLITGQISLNDRSESFVLETDIINDNDMIEFPEFHRVSVSAGIIQSTTRKVYENVPVTVLKPSEPYYVDVPELYSKITLQGTVLNLENYIIPRNTFYVDCSSITKEGTYLFSVKNSRIRNGEVTGIYPDEFRITVKKAIQEPVVEEPVEQEPETELDLEAAVNSTAGGEVQGGSE